MLLGTILKRLDTDADAVFVLESLGDLVLLAEVAAMGAVHDETPGEYASGATRRFAALASDEDWLALMSAIERSPDPARTVLERMVRWSLAKDRAEGDRAGGDHAHGHCGSAGGCSCAEGTAGHDEP